MGSSRLQRHLVRHLFNLLLLLIIAGVAPAQAARFLRFTTSRQGDVLALCANNQAVMRFKSGLISGDGLDHIAANLNNLALRGLKAGQVEAKNSASTAQIFAAGAALLEVDAAVAQSAQTTPLLLARNWAENLRASLAQPYITLDPPDSLKVPLGEQRTIRWGGTASSDISFSSQNPATADVELDPSGSALTVHGTGVGSTVVTAVLDEQQWTLPVEVRAWAARVPKTVVAEVTSPPLPPDDLRRTLRNAVLASLKPASGATVELGEPQRSGDDYSIEVSASGNDCFGVSTTVKVALKAVVDANPRSQELLVSNSPERIAESATLLRERLVGTTPVRLLWHHVNVAPRPLRFVVRIANLGDTEARVHMTDAATGPHDDEIQVGHSAMMRFIALSSQGEGYFLRLPAGRMLDLYDVRVPVGRIVSGVATLTPTAGTNLLLEVVAEDVWPVDAYFAPAPARMYSDPPLTPYRFEASKTVDLEQSAGSGWTFYHIGKDFSVNLQGQKLFGDYGVDYTIKGTFKNPTDKPARCEIALRAAGGVARCSYVLNGVLDETGLLRGDAEQIIYKVELPPGEQKTVSLMTIPESGSNYPITLTMRSWQ